MESPVTSIQHSGHEASSTSQGSLAINIPQAVSNTSLPSNSFAFPPLIHTSFPSKGFCFFFLLVFFKNFQGFYHFSFPTPTPHKFPPKTSLSLRSSSSSKRLLTLFRSKLQLNQHLHYSLAIHFNKVSTKMHFSLIFTNKKFQ